MPAGVPDVVPADGLTTKQRRQRPLLIIHTGDGKGKSTAAFGLALRGWNQGWSVGVFQFVKSAKWRIGEQTALESLDELHDTSGRGGSIEWHKMGAGWSWSRKAGTENDHAAAAAEGCRSVDDYADETGLSKKEIAEILDRLWLQGTLERAEERVHDRGRPRVIFLLADELNSKANNSEDFLPDFPS